MNLVSHHLTKSVKEVNKKNGREKEKMCLWSNTGQSKQNRKMADRVTNLVTQTKAYKYTDLKIKK